MVDRPVNDEVVFNTLCQFQARYLARMVQSLRDFPEETPKGSLAEWMECEGAGVLQVAIDIILGGEPSSAEYRRDAAAFMRRHEEAAQASRRILQDVASCLESLAVSGRVERVVRSTNGSTAVVPIRYRVPA